MFAICVAPASSASPDCAPAGSTEVAHNDLVTVYTHGSKRFKSGLRYPLYWYCNRNTRSRMSLDDGGATYVLPGSVSVRGHFVAYARDVGDGDADPSQPITIVQVNDTTVPAGNDSRTLVLPANQDGYAKVLRTRVTAHGSVVWSACSPSPDLKFESDLRTGSRARCRRPGARAWIFAASANASSPIQLDSGRTVAPRTLRLRGDTIVWFRANKRRTSSLAT